MHIICPECGTKYRLPDDKFKESIRFRCSVCKHVFSFSGALALSFDTSANDSHADPGASRESALSLEGGQQEAMHISMPASGVGNASLPASQPGISHDNAASAKQDSPLIIQDAPKRRGRGWLFCIIVLGILCWGFYWALLNTNYLDKAKPWLYANVPEQVFEWLPEIKADKAKLAMPGVDKAPMESLELKEVRQYIVENAKIGKLLVIEGKVKNNASRSCEMIQLDAELYSADGKKLASKRQVAGAFLSRLQLELLEKKELDDLVNNKVSIIDNNFSVRFGDEAPFTVIFDSIPPEATDYRIRISDATFLQPSGNLTQ